MVPGTSNYLNAVKIYLLKTFSYTITGYTNIINPLIPAGHHIAAYANSVYLAETAHNEPSHQDLYYLPLCS